MILNRLSIINYKNIRESTLVLSPKINCFIGSNGEGKTNVLDAMYFLSFCRSTTTPIDSQTITHGEEFFVLEGAYSDEHGGAVDIYCGMKRGQKKHFRRDKKEYKRLSQHIGLIPMILVSPYDTSLIDGGSEGRRHLLDVVISQCDSTYIEALASYSKALQQRNAMLKADVEPDADLMDIWEKEMARTGTVVYAKRAEFVDRLTPVFRQVYAEISGGTESVALEYVSHAQRGDLLDVIRRDRQRDRAAGYSLHGVHRDDLNMTLEGYPMRREGSQGQNKTFVIALKLAQFDFLRRTASHTTPLLLLDDIFDKLDAQRVENIVRIVAGSGYGQIFITDTNRDHIDRILRSSALDYKLFAVRGGNVSEVSGTGGEMMAMPSDE